MCGGEMEIVPCSKVGHVYKQKNVYTYPKGNLFQSLKKWVTSFMDSLAPLGRK